MNAQDRFDANVKTVGKAVAQIVLRRRRERMEAEKAQAGPPASNRSTGADGFQHTAQDDAKSR